MNQKDRILETLAAAKGPLCEGELILAVFKRHPKAFRLEGVAEDVPDARRVWVNLCGKTGLVDQGFIARDQGRYSLTEHGWAVAPRTDTGPIVRLRPDEAAVLAMLSGTAAFWFYQSNMADQIHQEDLAGWFGNPKTLADLETARARLASGSAVMDDGRLVSRAEADRLLECAEFLRNRFARELKRRTA